MATFSSEALSANHIPLLHAWLQQPHVMEFWDDGDRSLEDVKKHYLNRSDTKAYIAYVDGMPFAYLQICFIGENHELSHWKSKKYTTLGLDFFIGEPSFLGKGFAPLLLESFFIELSTAYLPYRLLVDPETHNHKALHIYDKIGFRRIGEFGQEKRLHTILKKDFSDRCVQIVPYDPDWPRQFQQEAQLLKEVLGDASLAVHHIGSTAIKGLCAKPKIDIMAVVKDFSSINIPLLVKIGYQMRGEVIPTGKYFAKELPRINLHVFEKDNPLIIKNLQFRNWLRTHPEDLTAYATLKQTLAAQFNEHNSMAYCRAKTDFIDSIIKRSDKNN